MSWLKRHLVQRAAEHVDQREAARVGNAGRDQPGIDAIVAVDPITALFDFALAGGWYSGLPELRERLQPGERLLLRPEPDNPFDANAVAVHHRGGIKLGFVPRRANAPVADLMARGRRVEAEVVGTLRVPSLREMPDELVFTGFSDGDPRLRLLVLG